MIKKLFTILVAAAALVAIVCVAYSLYLYSINGKTLSVRGEVQLAKSGETTWVTLEKGTKLEEGDRLRTGEASSCNVILGNAANTVIQAGENTEIVLTGKNPAGVELMDGELYAALTRPDVSGKFRVKTPNAVCGARGTGWRVSAPDSSSTVIDVYEGRVKSGSSMTMYDNEPYIARNAQELSAVGTETGSSQYSYSKLKNSSFAMWNTWREKASKLLTEARAINYMAPNSPNPYPAFQKGVNFVSWRANGYSDLESRISFTKMERETNANCASFIVTWYQDETFSTEIKANPDKTPSDESLEFILNRSRELGLRTMLSPHVDLTMHDNAAWRAEIGFDNNEDWDTWFANYEEFVLKYAALAEKHEVDIYNIGTELTLCATQRPDKWRLLIPKIRKVYSGKLIYTANWFEEYRDIRFWDLLDYAGISAYFPLTTRERPSIWDLKRNWKKWVIEIEAWQKNHQKPVVFTEIGYRSVASGAIEPWEYVKGGMVDLKTQHKAYKSVFETFWRKDWFYGMYWWNWRTNPNIQGKYHRGFTPMDKPAQELVKKWFAKPDPRTYKSWYDLAKDAVVRWFNNVKSKFIK